MVIKEFREVTPEPVEGSPGTTIRWVIDQKDGAPRFALRVFELEPGASTPFHSHWWEHEVFVLAGEGVVRGEGGESPLRAGNAVFVPPDEKHQFVNTGQEVFRFICIVPIVEPA